VLVGLAVGWLSSSRARRAAADDLRGSSARSTGGRRAVRTGWVLVTAQVAFAVVVATGAGLLAQSAVRLAAVDPGFDPADVTGLRLFLPEADYPAFDRVSASYRDAIEAARQVPGVAAASAVTFLPLRDGRIFFPYQAEGDTRPDGLPVPQLTKLVLDGYFEAMGIPVTAGRAIDRHDLDATTDAVVVNQAFARAWWPDADPIGRRIRYDTSATGAWYTVVGVVGDVRDRDVTTPAPPMVYLPYQSRHTVDRRWRELSLAVRARPGTDVVPAVLARLAALDRDVPVTDVRAMTVVVASASSRTTYTMWLLVGCAGAALFLAAVGVHGVLAHVVAGRRREVAVRLALGSSRRRVGALVVRQVGLVVVAGTGVGAGVALWSGRFVGALLFEVGPGDPTTLAGVVLGVATVAAIAAAGPAWRATRVDPIDALRGD
jgi:putative ABC transport system permease protein